MGKIEFTSGGNLGIGTGINLPMTIDVNGNYTQTNKFVINDNKHIKIGSDSPKQKLNIK